MAHWRQAFPGACAGWVALPRVAGLQAGLGLPLGAMPENGLPGSRACTQQDFGPPCPLGTEAATTPSAFWPSSDQLSQPLLDQQVGLCLCGPPAWSTLSLRLWGLVQCHLLQEVLSEAVP